ALAACHSTPTRGIALRCCAREGSGHAAAAPPRSVMNSRRFTGQGPVPVGRSDSIPQLSQELLRCGISMPAIAFGLKPEVLTRLDPLRSKARHDGGILPTMVPK